MMEKCLDCGKKTEDTEHLHMDTDPEPHSPMEVDENVSDHLYDQGTFNVSNSFNAPQHHEEESMVDSINDDTIDIHDRPTTFEVIEAASKRGKARLCDSNGFQYTVKRKTNSGKVYWWCSLRGKANRCPATVIQSGNHFQTGAHQHNHHGMPGIATAIKIKKKVKETAINNVFRSTHVIAEEIMAEEVDLRAPEGSRHKMVNLVRKANRARQRLRPDEPTDLTFDLDIDFLPDGFFRHDITVDGRRHILLATDEQLRLLAKAKTLYIDGTFKLIRRPFTPLLSIHVFIRSGDTLKQIPVAFAIMSGKRTKDYKKVLKKMKHAAPNGLSVESVVADVESGIWKAVQKTLQVPTHACVFHWPYGEKHKN